MFKLLVVVGVIALIVWAIRLIVSGVRELRPSKVDLDPPRPTPVGRHAWRIEEQQAKDSVTIEVSHPTKGVRRSWQIHRDLPHFDQLLEAARADAEILHSELKGGP
jgi:hypothetical protein